MSNINKQALRLTAEKAKDKFMPNFMVPTRDWLALLDELEAADRRNADLEALLEAEVRLWTQRYDCANSRREAAEKSNAFLKGQLAELANFNPDWDKLEASYESWREIAAELLIAKDRIAELEQLQNLKPCQKCNGTGMADSGGTQPWGEPIEIECDCRQQDARTAELLAAGIITKVGE